MTEDPLVEPVLNWADGKRQLLACTGTLTSKL